jgi:hypothetical protein
VGEVLVKIDDAGRRTAAGYQRDRHGDHSSDPNALSIPREALHSENGKTYVYKVVNGGFEREPT